MDCLAVRICGFLKQKPRKIVIYLDMWIELFGKATIFVSYASFKNVVKVQLNYGFEYYWQWI